MDGLQQTHLISPKDCLLHKPKHPSIGLIQSTIDHSFMRPTMDDNKAEDPRAKSNRYSKNAIAKFDPDRFDFVHTQFLIDDYYVGEPPQIQVSIENLNDNIDEKFLKKDLEKLGKIRTLEILRHPRTRQHLGLAKVEFEEVSVARACVESYNKKKMMGLELVVDFDLRFANIEQKREKKLNPQLATQQKLSLPPLIAQQQQQQQQQMPIQVLTTTPSLPNANLHHHPHLNPHQTPILPILHPQLQNSNHTGLIPSPHSLEYPATTPGSLVSSTPTPESTNRQRLEDRIASLMKQPNCMLSTIVAPTAPQASPIYSAFSLNETNYANSSYCHPKTNAQLKAHEWHRNSELNDLRRPVNNHHTNNSNHYRNNRDTSYHKYDKVNNKSDHYPETNSDDEWNVDMPIPKKEPLNIELSERQIESEVLPYCYNEFYKDLSKNLLDTIFKKLRENHGYQVLEKAQTAFKMKQDKLKIQREKEMLAKQHEREFERRYMSKARTEPVLEAPRRPNVMRQRNSDFISMQNQRSRVNRSAACVAEPERRVGHNTSIDDGDYLDSDDSDGDDSISSSSSAASSSSESSGSSSRSASTFSQSSSRSSDSDSPVRMQISKNDIPKKEFTYEDSNSNCRDESRDDPSVVATNSEQIAINALLSITASGYSDTNHVGLPLEEDEDDIVKRPPKSAAKKRKKKSTEVIGVASEYRAAKRFASDPTGALGSFDENIENAMVDENLLGEKPEAKFMYPERSAAEKKRMLDDLNATLTEEDLRYLHEVHNQAVCDENNDVKIPFGSDNANKAHLNLRKHMIEGKSAEGHPKWWRGCSRCDVIEVSENQKADTREDNEEMNYEDLTKAPIKSHVIQAANSSRRDLRGDQRRIAALNPNLDPDVLKMYTTSTLKMRAKNLRFSRSKIHKWGLFACEKIASGDAVIEYVGEKIRPSLADHREKIVYTNLPTHDGSSYFFRVDYDVIDATLKGNKARFINHSCNPNCIAKVIKHDNGSNSIVIYAKQAIKEDEEITYDYKFPREETSDKICCNCRAPNCQKYLN